MKKIFISGGGGMLGSAIYSQFRNQYELITTDIDINEDWIQYLDFRDKKEYFSIVKHHNPDALFHIGAHTSLEYCEENQDDAYLTNTLSVEYATEIANQLNIPLIFISTAGIFDGKKDFYDDWDIPNPLGVYARSKFLAEQFVINHSKNYLICRAGWMMGGGLKKDKKFIKKIVEIILSGTKELNIVNDKLGTPTYTVDFANNLKLLFENNIRGLFNLVCQGETSRLEVAKFILNFYNLEDKVIINEVSSDYFSSTYHAPRPYCERLINYKLNLINMNIMRDWEICLKEYLINSFNEIN